MFTSRILRAATRDPTIKTVYKNPYKARKIWPPDVAKLPPKQQFRLERKFRRRTKMKFERPGWIKGVKLTQWTLCLGVAAYFVLFMDWKEMETPFPRLRRWINGKLDSLWTVNSSQSWFRLPEEPDGRPRGS